MKKTTGKFKDITPVEQTEHWVPRSWPTQEYGGYVTLLSGFGKLQEYVGTLTTDDAKQFKQALHQATSLARFSTEVEKMFEGKLSE